MNIYRYKGGNSDFGEFIYLDCLEYGACFKAAVEKVYKKQRGKISVPGFRKGKAPRKIIEGMYGSGVFYEDAINDLYPEAYAQAIEQEKLDGPRWRSWMWARRA